MRTALLALIALAACASAPPQEPPAFDLAGSSWVLITDATPAPTIAFTDRGASGSAGCNRWFSSIERNQDALTFGNIGATRMACPEPQMATERAFIAALDQTAAFERDDENTLRLIGREAETLLTFRRAR